MPSSLYAGISNYPKNVEMKFDLGARVGAGYNIDFKRYFGIGAEVGYGIYSAGATGGENNNKKLSDDNGGGGGMLLHGLDINAVGTFYIKPNATVFLKGGAMQDNLMIISENKTTLTAFHPMASVGFAYYPLSKLGLTLTVGRVFGENISSFIEKGDFKSIEKKSPAFNYAFFGVKIIL